MLGALKLYNLYHNSLTWRVVSGRSVMVGSHLYYSQLITWASCDISCAILCFSNITLLFFTTYFRVTLKLFFIFFHDNLLDIFTKFLQHDLVSKFKLVFSVDCVKGKLTKQRKFEAARDIYGPSSTPSCGGQRHSPTIQLKFEWAVKIKSLRAQVPNYRLSVFVYYTTPVLQL